MDKDEKKKLKMLGKELVEHQSRELREALSKTNPAKFGSRQHLRNEIEMLKGEKHVRLNSSTRTLDEVEKEYVLLFKHKDGTQFGVGTNLYWLCQECKFLVPSEPEKPESCLCKNLYIEPIQFEMVYKEDGTSSIKRTSVFDVRTPSLVQLVQLLPIAKKTRKWQFWK